MHWVAKPKFNQLQLPTMSMWILLTLLLSILTLATSGAASSMEKQTYIIHMDESKIPSWHQSESNSEERYQFESNSDEWYQSLLTSISTEAEDGAIGAVYQETAPPQLLYTYKNVLSGFAARLSENEVEALSQVDGFISAVPDRVHTLDTTYSPRFLGLRPGKGLLSASNMASDTIIGMIDSGVWPENPSFRDEGMSEVPSKWKGTCQLGSHFTKKNCNKKLIGARYYYKGFEAFSGIKISDTFSYKSARDSQNHGTHMASTAGGGLVDNVSFFGLGNGTAAGMRYTSRIAAYKACWPGACTSTDVVAAIDQAVADGVDIISVSLGGAGVSYYEDPFAMAFYGAVEKGVFVSCSAGNDGPDSFTMTNFSPWIMSVGASYTDRNFATTVKLGNKETFSGSSMYAGNVTFTGELPIVYNKTAGKSGAEYCKPGALDEKLVRGKLVACYQGPVSRLRQGVEVKLAGGAGLLLLNVDFQGEEAYAEAHVLPEASLGNLAAQALIKYIASTKNPTGSILFRGTTFGDRAPRVAAFSSRGPSEVEPNLIKPDVIAPGVNIIAGYPPIVSPTEEEYDKRRVMYAAMSGTSMACPHVSGLAALIKSVHKDWSPAAIKSALMTTAYTLDNRHSPIEDVSSYSPATPFSMGSGHVDPEKAADPGLVYDTTTKDYLLYFCSLNYTKSQIAAIAKKTFHCPKNVALQPGDLNYPSFLVYFKGNTKDVTHKRTLTNVGPPTAEYLVEVAAPSGVSVVVNPQVLSFKKLGQKLSYSVRFVGISGKAPSGNYTYGSLAWASGKHTVAGRKRDKRNAQGKRKQGTTERKMSRDWGRMQHYVYFSFVCLWARGHFKLRLGLRPW